MSNALNALAARLGVPANAVLEALVELGETHTKVLQQRFTDYRRLRKYTTPSLAKLDTVPETNRIRSAIGSGANGPLLVSELIAFLQQQEADVPEWKKKRLPPADGVPRKRGRPRKVATTPEPSPRHV